MFPKKPVSHPPFQSPGNRSVGTPGFSILGPDTAIRGDIVAEADLHIEGSIEGDVTCATLVQGEARTLESLLTYADRLKATGAFEDVTLIRHETNEQDPAHPIRLRINLLLKRTRPGASASSAEK